MAEKRNISKEDIFLKALLLPEGLRLEVNRPPDKTDFMRAIVFDGCGVVSALPQNPYSRLKDVVEGVRVSISDMGEVLGTATYEDRPDWLDIPMSNGQPAITALPGFSMDPAYFAAICPGKHAAHPLEYWKEAQVAAVEVFGPWRGSCTSVVMGLESMTCLVEGVEERLSRGVLTTPPSVSNRHPALHMSNSVPRPQTGW